MLILIEFTAPVRHVIGGAGVRVLLPWHSPRLGAGQPLRSLMMMMSGFSAAVIFPGSNDNVTGLAVDGIAFSACEFRVRQRPSGVIEILLGRADSGILAMISRVAASTTLSAVSASELI